MSILIFFLQNYHYFSGSIETDFNQQLFIDNGFELSEKNIDTIINTYKQALEYCENDIDRFIVLQDLCDFLKNCDDQDELHKKYLKECNSLLDAYGREKFADDYSKWRGFTSEKLR